jgi:hypothetical protein
MVSRNPMRLLETVAATEDGPAMLMEIADNIGAFALEVAQSLNRIEGLLRKPLEDERDLRGSGSRAEGIIRRVRVTTAGTAVQGPSVPIPRGVETVIRQRRHSETRNGYVALTEAEVSSTGTRSEIQNNDTVKLQVSNWSKIWFDADTSETDFELIAEQ